MDRASEMMIFVRCVEDGSFSAAARALDMTPSAISKQIRRLEDRLGARLFNRTTRRISLTEVGRDFYDRCSRIMVQIEEAEEAVSSLQDQVRGTLRVTGTAAFARGEVLPRINRFLSRHPELNLEFELTDRQVDLVDEGVDAAIMLQEQVNDPSLVARKLAVNRRIIVASPDYIRRNGEPQTPEELLDHNCLTLYNVSRFNDWEFEFDDGSPRVIHVRGNFHANTASALYEAALAGVGLARLSTWLVAPRIRSGELVQLLPGYTQESSAYYVLFPQGRHLSRKVRAFVDFLVDEFTPLPPWEREDLELVKGIRPSVN
ncbi:LysR family transcriptional regulator [Aquisalimonas asiatica]|uniref:DNA-binding transcriptional regulator, LysR family n=1 Tax=Aquisalimonas asiatica TaxID=406100 RepID=A0A1H8U014_9GAMM|nr:LysR family transcriptional regulator [Aquisalimonas asiatica]SEO96455.1 DNA-binding transcriptional regulator, LysR family [Aquisalimonas asiatica]